MLDNPKDNMERGQCDKFLIRSEDVTPLTRVKVPGTRMFVCVCVCLFLCESKVKSSVVAQCIVHAHLLHSARWNCVLLRTCFLQHRQPLIEG